MVVIVVAVFLRLSLPVERREWPSQTHEIEDSPTGPDQDNPHGPGPGLSLTSTLVESGDLKANYSSIGEPGSSELQRGWWWWCLAGSNLFLQVILRIYWFCKYFRALYIELFKKSCFIRSDPTILLLIVQSLKVLFYFATRRYFIEDGSSLLSSDSRWSMTSSYLEPIIGTFLGWGLFLRITLAMLSPRYLRLSWVSSTDSVLS